MLIGCLTLSHQYGTFWEQGTTSRLRRGKPALIRNGAGQNSHADWIAIALQPGQHSEILPLKTNKLNRSFPSEVRLAFLTRCFIQVMIPLFLLEQIHSSFHGAVWEAEFPRGPPGLLRVGLLHLCLRPRTPSDARWACVSCGGQHLTSTQHCLQLRCLWTSVLNLSKNLAWFPHLGKTLWSEAPANVSQVRKTIPCSSDGRDVGAFSRSGDWGRSTHTNSLIHSLDQWLVLTLYLSELSCTPKLAAPEWWQPCQETFFWTFDVIAPNHLSLFSWKPRLFNDFVLVGWNTGLVCESHTGMPVCVPNSVRVLCCFFNITVKHSCFHWGCVFIN